jgi:hypothetical protein
MGERRNAYRVFLGNPEGKGTNQRNIGIEMI